MIRPATILVALVLFPMGCYTMAQSSSPGGSDASFSLSQPVMTTAAPLKPPDPGMAQIFRHGYLIRFQRRSVSSNDPNIVLFGLKESTQHAVRLWQQGASEILLTSVDVSTTGKLGFAGRLRKKDKSSYLFIGTSNIDGSAVHLFGTGNYRASQVALSDDGTMWTIGAERAIVQRRPDGAIALLWSNYDTLRHYDLASGAILEHFLPRWESEIAYVIKTSDPVKHSGWAAYDATGQQATTARWDPTWSDRSAFAGSTNIFLRSSGSSVVLYDGLHDRVCIHKKRPSSVQCAAITTFYENVTRVTGLVITRDGQIVASMSAGLDRNSTRGLFALDLMSSSSGAQWRLVPGTRSNGLEQGDLVELLCDDGSNLAYRRVDSHSLAGNIYESRWMPQSQ